MDRLVNREDSQTIDLYRYRLFVKGIVQGVGFRPFIYRLAHEQGIHGYVFNQLGEVVIEAEGPKNRLESFINLIQRTQKGPIKVESIQKTPLVPTGEKGFFLQESKNEGQACNFTIPPDMAVCPDCLKDMEKEESRYYQYPFTSCTNCGPRYTVTHNLPYDRHHTSMVEFPFCEDCKKEYMDPLNRRFHAQTIACPQCGPQVSLVDDTGEKVSDDWVAMVHHFLRDGKILAVKGIGGFHLVCDAGNEDAVHRLRQRKHRPRKPFALMARGIEEIEQYFHITPRERDALTGTEAPILLIQPGESIKSRITPGEIAPGINRLGVMIAYAPLHPFLFSEDMPFLIVTSGNKSGQPIARTNEEALKDLKGIADYFLLHNREIIIRADDSVAQVVDEKLHMIRRSRGYVPGEILIPTPPMDKKGRLPIVFAAGGEMKNALCFTRENRAYMSHHIGEMDCVEGMESYKQAYEHIRDLLQLQPEVIAYDPHPGYIISDFSRDLVSQGEIQDYAVYHHHAHMVSCMAEHQLNQSVIGCIIDGTGYGRDGKLWGFEILTGDCVDFERVGYLQPLPLPGGEASIRHPWMMAASLLYETLQEKKATRKWLERLFPSQKDRFSLVLAQLDGTIPAVKASSGGRLFDGVSALLGICMESSYEGEAAILLGEKAAHFSKVDDVEPYPFQMYDGEILIQGLVKGLLRDMENSLPVETIAGKFHLTVCEMVVAGAKLAREKTGNHTVVLSGGVWNNPTLLHHTRKKLELQGFTVYTNEKVPAGDGGIALGQAVSALWRWQKDVSIGSRSCD